MHAARFLSLFSFLTFFGQENDQVKGASSIVLVL
jgi:hypothetical protein